MLPELDASVIASRNSHSGEWAKYSSIFERPDWPTLIHDNPLFVMHPEFCFYYPDENRYLRPVDYEKYQRARNEVIRKALRDNRTICTLVHTNYLVETESNVPIPLTDSIMIPTSGTGIDVNLSLVKKPDNNQFWSAIAEQITHGEICGEYGDYVSCISGLEKIFQRLSVPLQRIEPAIYYNLSELEY
jgi:hypothetical protein